MEKEAAINNVVDIQRVFPKSFAIYGTALGSIREQNIISHDLDTDCGIMSEDFSWEDVNSAIKLGFDILMVYGSSHYGLEIAFYRDGVKTDLMVFYKSKKDENKIFNCLWKNGGVNGLSDQIIHEYDKDMFEVIDGRLDKYIIRTLGVKYIEHVYGGKWKVPVTKWDWRTDHKCIKQ